VRARGFHPRLGTEFSNRSICMSNPALAGKRVLVVEDELLVAMLIEDILHDNGCIVLGPFATLPEALAAAADPAIDIAVLDVNLRGQKVYPVGELLAERGIPFFLLSGYGEDAAPADHPEWKVCAKPFKPEAVTRMLEEQAR
jgi:CheY-like chemotaxis protein